MIFIQFLSCREHSFCNIGPSALTVCGGIFMAEAYYKQHWIEIEPERHAAYDHILAFHPAMDPLIRPLELLPGQRVLDVGSGPGHTTFELARRVSPGGKVTGVDINAEFIARSRARAREHAVTIEFVQA